MQLIQIHGLLLFGALFTLSEEIVDQPIVKRSMSPHPMHFQFPREPLNRQAAANAFLQSTKTKKKKDPGAKAKAKAKE